MERCELCADAAEGRDTCEGCGLSERTARRIGRRFDAGECAACRDDWVYLGGAGYDDCEGCDCAECGQGMSGEALRAADGALICGRPCERSRAERLGGVVNLRRAAELGELAPIGGE